MSELAPPLTRTRRGAARLEAVERLTAQSAQLLSLARLEMNALLTEDTAPGMQGYLADELALLLAESPGTAGRLLTAAHIYASYPAVVQRVGLPLAQGGWSLRHADALLDAIMGVVPHE